MREQVAFVTMPSITKPTTPVKAVQVSPTTAKEFLNNQYGSQNIIVDKLFDSMAETEVSTMSSPRKPVSTSSWSPTKHAMKTSFIQRNSDARDSLLVTSHSSQLNSQAGLEDSYSDRMSSTNTDGLAPFLHAAKTGNLVVLNALIIQPGTDVLRRDPVYGQSALHFAIRGGHLAIVHTLLMPQIARSIVNIPDNRRNTALHLAAAKSRRMTKIILDAHGDVNFLNCRNQTPLGVHLITTRNDDPSMCDLLLKAGANPDSPVDKSTALHVALDKKLLNIAAKLVEYGARLDRVDETGRMVFDKVDEATLTLLLKNIKHAPVLIPDNSRKNCMGVGCGKSFSSLSNRRHHCRLCGRLLCKSCSNHKIKGEALPFKVGTGLTKRKQNGVMKQMHRVCDQCFLNCAPTNS